VNFKILTLQQRRSETERGTAVEHKRETISDIRLRAQSLVSEQSKDILEISLNQIAKEAAG
jgi:hypothetical protein